MSFNRPSLAFRRCLQVDRRPSNAMTAPFLFPPPLKLRKPDSEDAQLQKVLEINGRKEKSEEVCWPESALLAQSHKKHAASLSHGILRNRHSDLSFAIHQGAF